MPITTSRTRHAAAAALVALSLTAALSACGDSDSPTEGTPAADAAPQDTAAPATTADAAATSEASEPAPAASDDEQRFGADLEQTGEVIVETFEEAEGYSIDGQTLTITFGGDTTVGFDGMIDCLSVKGLMNEDEVLILEYPDGSDQCSP